MLLWQQDLAWLGKPLWLAKECRMHHRTRSANRRAARRSAKKRRAHFGRTRESFFSRRVQQIEDNHIQTETLAEIVCQAEEDMSGLSIVSRNSHAKRTRVQAMCHQRQKSSATNTDFQVYTGKCWRHVTLRVHSYVNPNRNLMSF